MTLDLSKVSRKSEQQMEKVDNLGCIKIKIFASYDIINSVMRQPTEWEKYFEIYKKPFSHHIGINIQYM